MNLSITLFASYRAFLELGRSQFVTFSHLRLARIQNPKNLNHSTRVFFVHRLNRFAMQRQPRGRQNPSTKSYLPSSISPERGAAMSAQLTNFGQPEKKVTAGRVRWLKQVLLSRRRFYRKIQTVSYSKNLECGRSRVSEGEKTIWRLVLVRQLPDNSRHKPRTPC